MIPGVMAAQRVVAPTAAAALWTPLNMATVPQIYLDAQDSVVTDVSGACSAISNLGAMGANGDFSQATAGNRPAILAAELNGKRVLRFDGVDDVLLGGTNEQKNIFNNAPAAWLFTVYKKRALDGINASRVLFYTTPGTGTSWRFAAYTGSNTTGAANKLTVFGRRLDADSGVSGLTAVAVDTQYHSAFFEVVYATGAARIEADAVSLFSSGSFIAVPGNTSATTSTQSLAIGAFYTAGGAADADIACVIISNTAPSAADIDRLNGWAAHKYGLTASLPGAHPYKTTAPTV
jgi:hypothetical protein